MREYSYIESSRLLAVWLVIVTYDQDLGCHPSYAKGLILTFFTCQRPRGNRVIATNDLTGSLSGLHARTSYLFCLQLKILISILEST